MEKYVSGHSFIHILSQSSAGRNVLSPERKWKMEIDPHWWAELAT